MDFRHGGVFKHYNAKNLTFPPVSLFFWKNRKKYYSSIQGTSGNCCGMWCVQDAEPQYLKSYLPFQPPSYAELVDKIWFRPRRHALEVETKQVLSLQKRYSLWLFSLKNQKIPYNHGTRRCDECFYDIIFVIFLHISLYWLKVLSSSPKYVDIRETLVFSYVAKDNEGSSERLPASRETQKW